MTRREAILAAAAAAAAAAAVFFAHHPSTRFWAFSNGADLAPAARALWTAAAPIPLVLFLILLRRTDRAPDGDGRRAIPPAVLVAAAAAASFLLFTLLPSRNLFHGDGWLLTTFLERDADPIEIRPGWGTIWIHRLAFRALREAGVAEARFASFALLSALSGAVYVAFVPRAARSAARGLPAAGPAAALGAALLLTTGAMQLFFGHVENYSLPQAAILAFLATGAESLASGRRPLLPFLCFTAAVFLHFASVLLFPALLFLLVVHYLPRFLRTARIVFLAGFALVFFLPPTGTQLRLLVAFHPWTSAGHPFSHALFSPAHLLFLLNLLFLLIPMPAAVFLASIGRHRPEKNAAEEGRGGFFLALAALPFALFVFHGKPFLGNRDWDLFAFVAPPAALLAARLLARRIRPRALLPAAILAGGTGLFLLVPWIAGNADGAAAGTRTLRFALDDPYHWHGRRPRALDLATVMAERGQGGAARVLFERVVRRRPDLAVARADWGIILWNEGRYAEAKEHLAAATELDPSLDPPLYYLGAALFHLSEGDLGESRFREFLERKPGNPSAEAYLGRVLLARGEWREAEERLLAAERILPRNADLQAWLGLARLRLGDKDGVRERAGRALRLDPDHEEARRLLAEIEPDGDKREESIRTFASPRGRDLR